ncbi:hypothetical protein VNI00_006871 [Paramarasmius palmivorus]|uniref:Cyclin-domain-containing protein n=1 Tax=Paramarasmius palmivorus TaxID=297713 RepID=A0AAW0D8Y2_9AGAR
MPHIHTTTLPPIASFDKQILNHHHVSSEPLTPPEDVPPPHYSPSPNRLPPIITSYPSDMVVDDVVVEQKTHQHLFFVDSTVAVDWLDFSRTRSAHFIAEKTCEMICYLWFSSPPSESQSHSKSHSPTSTTANNLFTQPNSPHSLQFNINPAFVQFMQKLLETTQVSQSVIVLSLHYIFRLKEKNRFTTAASGSEFRIAVAGLMMANKFLDDNTYTNKTWSEVSGIDLGEINRMEREFLMGVDCNLYVDKATYESWLNLLKGLVMAKERDNQQFRKSNRRNARGVRQPGSHITNTPSRYVSSSRYRVPSHRARSTSPSQTARSLPYLAVPPQYSAAPPASHNAHSHVQVPQPRAYEPSTPVASNQVTVPRSGSKRSAEAAFSPTSASFSDIPTKRPVSISLQIPESSGTIAGPNSSSYSPLDVQSFEKMSIDSPAKALPRPSSHSTRTGNGPASWSSSSPTRRSSVPETLVTAYALDEGRRSAVPQNLYFYSLACSPMEDEDRSRKARLRYHQPPPPSTTYQPLPRSALPANIQSASTSPNDAHLTVPVPTALPHFNDTVWTRPQTQHHHSHFPQYHQPQPRHAQQAQHLSYPPPILAHEPPRYQYQPTQTRLPPMDVEGEDDDHSPQVQSAPFANAGPPGVGAQFYPTPGPTQRYAWRRSMCQ